MRATSKATRAILALPAHRDRKGPPEQQDPEALPAHRDRKGPPGQQGPEALPAHRVHKGRKGPPGQQGPPVRVVLHQVAATGCAFQMERRSAGTPSIQTEAIIHGHFRWHFLIRNILLLLALSHFFRLFVRTKKRHHAQYLE